MAEVVLGIAILSGLVIVFYTLPRMCIEGALTGSEAALVGVLLLAVAISLARFGREPWGAVLAIAYLGAVGYLPYIRVKLRGRTQEALLTREIERWERTIAFDPQNAGAYVFLAQAYAEMGDLENAMKSYEAALRLRPNDVRSRQEYNRLLQQKRSETGAGWTCLVCRCENEAEAVRCFRCEAPAPRSVQKPHWVDTYMPHVGIGVAVVLVALWALQLIGQGALLALSLLAFAVVYTMFALRRPE